MTLEEFFEEHPKIALAFSGGVDSSYLLYVASRCGADVAAYYVKSQFQPEFELRDAIELAHKLGVRMRLIEQDIVSCAEVTANPPDRCYYCKKRIFTALGERARSLGFAVLADGANFDDREDYRPGAKAADELGVAHPLQLFLIQADLHLAVEDGDRRGHAALIADDLLDLAAEVEVLRIGHAMAEDRGFQRNNGLTLGKRGLDFRGDGQIFFKIHSDIPPKSSG